MSEVEFRPEKLLEVLARHGVRHVLIGGFAGVIHGSPYVTTDIDVVPDPAAKNLERLSAALDELHARDQIEFVMSNGSTRGFTVTSAGLVAADLVSAGHFDTQGAARVTLVTCAGAWDTGKQVNAERFVVEASPA